MKKYFLQMSVMLFILFTFCVTLPYAIAEDEETETVSYTYDDVGRLVKEDYGDTVIKYKYDPAGNLLEKKAADIDIDIKINGSDGPFTITQGTDVAITVSLDPLNHAGEDADWWLYATDPFGGGWYYTLDSGWQLSVDSMRAYGGPLFKLAPYTIPNMPTWSTGTYTFNFSVDDNEDNKQDDTYLDSASVIIQ